jgi:hypothetical protein
MPRRHQLCRAAVPAFHEKGALAGRLRAPQHSAFILILQTIQALHCPQDETGGPGTLRPGARLLRAKPTQVLGKHLIGGHPPWGLDSICAAQHMALDFRQFIHIIDIMLRRINYGQRLLTASSASTYQQEKNHVHFHRAVHRHQQG